MRALLPSSGPGLLKRLEDSSMPEPNSGCRLWLRNTWGGGYGRISVGGVERPAHVVAWELHHGKPVPPGLHICHKCDVRACIEPTHLFDGTRSDNMADMHRKGRGTKHCRKGVSNGRSRLTEAEVRAIRLDPRSGNDTAAAFNISRTVVSHIRLGLSWKHVK